MGSPKLPLRINIYSLDKEGFPKKNILKKDIVFTPSSKKMKWYQFALDDQKIEMTEYGVCIALEFLNPSTQEYTLDKEYSPIYLAFFSSEYTSLANRSYSKGWFDSNGSTPAIALEIEF